MEGFINLSGLSTTTLDFTADLSLLVAGLLSLFGLSAGMIIWIAARRYLTSKIGSATTTGPASPGTQEAA
jgi:hypothetical protein